MRTSREVTALDASMTAFARCAVGVLQVTRELEVHNVLDPGWQRTCLYNRGEAFSQCPLKGNGRVFMLRF